MKLRSKTFHEFPLLLYTVVGNNFDRADEGSRNSGSGAFAASGEASASFSSLRWLRDIHDTPTQLPWSVCGRDRSTHAARVRVIFRTLPAP